MHPMATFADLPIPLIRTDCRHYSGYRPCGHGDACPGCDQYAPRGAQVLIIKLGAMGDVLRTKSLLPALRRAHEPGWIVWLTNPGSEPIVRDPLVDEIRTFTTEGIAALEGRQFARILCLDKDPHAVALARRLEGTLKQGFAPTEYNTVTVWNSGSEEALRLGLSDDFKFRQNRKSVPQILHDMAELPYDGASYGLQVPDASRRRAAALFTSLRIPTDKPIIGLNTGCGPVFATKAWPQENLAELLRLLGGEATLLLLGGTREAQLHVWLRAQAVDLFGRSVFDAGTNHPLEDFFAIVERCSAVLSSDSLAMHVAIALRKPLVAYFGPTCEQEVDLFGLGERLLTDFPCAPCYLKSCPMPVFCLSQLRAETVADALRRVLAR